MAKYSSIGKFDRNSLIVTVFIDSNTLEMELDIGASCSIISEETYKKLHTKT